MGCRLSWDGFMLLEAISWHQEIALVVLSGFCQEESLLLPGNRRVFPICGTRLRFQAWPAGWGIARLAVGIEAGSVVDLLTYRWLAGSARLVACSLWLMLLMWVFDFFLLVLAERPYCARPCENHETENKYSANN